MIITNESELQAKLRLENPLANEEEIVELQIAYVGQLEKEIYESTTVDEAARLIALMDSIGCDAERIAWDDASPTVSVMKHVEFAREHGATEAEVLDRAHTVLINSRRVEVCNQFNVFPY